MKQVEFDIELVKKIQSGEVKGIIKTRKGNTARFLGEINDHVYPLIFAINEIQLGIELSRKYTKTGKYYSKMNKHDNDIILEIEEPKQESQFKTFDKVLVRDRDSDIWMPDFFSLFREDNFYKYACVGSVYTQCIPYEGNEHLLGTTNKPKEE